MADDVLAAPGAGGVRLWDTVKGWFTGKRASPGEVPTEGPTAVPIATLGGATTHALVRTGVRADEVATGPGIRPGGHEAMALLRAVPKNDDPEKNVVGGRQGMPKVTSYIELDRVGQVRSVIRTFEEGSSYEGAAGLADNMLRDDRIFAAWQKRTGALVSSAIEIKPAGPGRKEKKIAELLGGNDDAPGLWHEMFPRAAVADLSGWGRFLGIGVAEIIWNFDDANFATFTIRTWHAQFLRWDENRQRLQLRTVGGLIDLPDIETGVHSDGKWIIYAPYGIRAPWRRALIRPLSMQYLARQWTYRDLSRWGEKFGLATDFVKMPANAPADEKLQVANAIANRGNEAAIFVTAEAKDAPGYSMQVVQVSGEGAEALESYAAKIEANIAILINGQNLTTEAGDVGSYALGKVHEGVELRILLDDAGIADVLVKQALWHWTNRNWGDPKLTSRVRYIVEEPDDELRTAQTYAEVGAFVSALQLGGFDVDLDAIAELWGIPVVPEDEDDDTKAAPNDAKLSPDDLALIVTVNEARAAAGLGALTTESGAVDPDGNLTMAEFKAKHAALIAPAPAVGGDNAGGGGAGGQGGGPPAPEPSDDETEDDEDPEAKGLKRLSKKATKVVRLATKQGTMLAGHRRHARYADALKASGKKRLARAMSHDLKDVNGIIAKARTPVELRAMLTAHFKGTDSKAMAKIIERAGVLAHLAGRLSVLEEV